MKKIFLAIMVAVVMLFSACNSDEEQTKAREGEREARVVKDVHLRAIEGTYGNRVITLRCEDSLYIEYRGQELSTLHHCSSKYELSGGTTEEIAALNGCYEVDSLSGALLGTSMFVRFLGDQVEDALLTLPGNRVASDFSLQITPCHAQLRMVCFNTDQRKLIAKGIYQENPTDTAYAIGEWLGVIIEKDTVQVIDTVRVNDSTVVIRERDTVWEYGVDTTYMVDSTFTVITHNSEDPNGVMAGNVLTFTCYNSVTTMTYRNGQPYSSSPQNFAGKFPYNYSESGTYRTSHVGQAHRVVNGSASWGGFTQSFVHQDHYTIPSGYEAWLRYLNCDFVVDSVYGQATGILIVGHFECGDHHTRASYFIPKTPSGGDEPPTPPTVISVETTYVHLSTTAQGVWSPTTSTMTWTCQNRRDIDTTWSNSNHTYNHFPFNISHPFLVTFNGDLYTYQIGEKVAFNAAGVATFSNGTTLTLSALARQCVLNPIPLPCAVSGDSVEVVSTGVRITGTNFCNLHADPVWGNVPKNLITPQVIDKPGVLKAIYITDNFIGNGSGMTTYIVTLYENAGVYTSYMWNIANTITATNCVSASVDVNGYNRFNTNKTNANWALSYINTVGAPSHIGYLTHNSDPTIGDYWATLNDGVNRNHCNIGGYANGWDGHNPIHFRNVTDSVVTINGTYHGHTVSGTWQ